MFIHGEGNMLVFSGITNGLCNFEAWPYIESNGLEDQLNTGKIEMSVTIYHNPRCSKSRQTLQLLQDNGIEPTIIEYLNTPPSAEELAEILTKMGKGPRDVIRKKEAAEEGIDAALDGEELIKAIVTHPRALERPIVVKGDKAAMGRPPESVLEIL
jgi:arsenate reductase (glutaredoxin)